MQTRLLSAPFPRHEKVGPDTRIRQRLIRPGDVLLSYEGGFMDKAVAWAGRGVFSHAGIFVNKNCVLEASFGGSVITRLKVHDFERSGRYCEPLMKIPHATIAGVYRNEHFLSALRLQALSDLECGRISFMHPPKLRFKGGQFSRSTNFRRIHEEIELIVDARATILLNSAMQDSLFLEYPLLADLARGLAFAVPEDEQSLIRRTLARLAKSGCVHSLFSAWEKAFPPFGGEKVPPLRSGPFCSQLVCEMFIGMGYPLSVAAPTASPSELARCPELSCVEGAISQGPAGRVSLEDAANAPAMECETAVCGNEDGISRFTRSHVQFLRAAEIIRILREFYMDIRRRFP
ncbi:hypothetical protein JW721_02275 [Candidatus Micrarchaeota archaeon]|nr:hypothetical protein [Candidatus Micrarchaeota archaeon]